ncbi:ParB/RepB/Spo0J family partition protein [Paenirhodobacter populi]|uniref:ParB/RepB/Spo0J family partition protein n=1 Tax=Paenirhodobacter populi TaxID=2306993 RepID=A0A443JRJ9_9RHOB|nr:ParB/RepB/Spo0J family partition protein [Sinirhodobacter populi]RWR23082.1 ParB/RepB/Spo0J family partition protein [Sinirhodobacter populi]
MAKAVQKITLSRSRDIPFDKLVLSQSNVRKIKADISIEELAEDIARRGLLQSLNVRALLDDEGNETGMFDVPAGGRRFQALALLVKQKRLAKNAPVPCIMREGESDILAEDDSLAENTQRAALHPLDQFRAFQTLREKGQTEEQIAAAFFVPATVVKQRMKLASVAPELLEVYAADQMTLEELMAFTVSSDPERQVQVWNAVKDTWQRDPHHIRRRLHETSVRCSDRRVRLIGLEAYELAGGTRTRDLFEDDNGGWIEDVGLLDRLVSERLKAEAETIATEGWKWVKADVSFEYGHSHGLRKLVSASAQLTEEEYAIREALRTEFDELDGEYASPDGYPEEIDARLGEIEAALEAYDNRPETFDPAEIARAGVFLSITLDGKFDVQRGFVRPDDEAPQGQDDAGDNDLPDRDYDGRDGAYDDRAPATVVSVGGQPPEPEEDEGDAIKPLPDRLLSELTAYRTIALQDAVALHPHVAMTLLLHKLVTDGFRTAQARCLEASVRAVHPSTPPEDLASFPPALSIAERHQAWQQDIPQEDDQALWDWIVGLDEASRLALLAHCVSFGVNAQHEKPNPYSGYGLSAHALQCRAVEADRLARATDLDMVETGWQPTVENYLGRVTKPRILEAVREAKGEGAAQLIDHLKKGDMAREAARLLDGTGWLPEILRVEGDEDLITTEEDTAPVENLPAFLADETVDPEPATDDAEAGELVAAE